MQAVILAVLAVAGISAVAVSGDNSLETIDISKRPSVAAIYYKDEFDDDVYELECTGVILNKRHILCSIYCAWDIPDARDPGRFQVRVGSSNSAAGGNVYTIENVNMHARRVGIFKAAAIVDDVAILRTTADIVFSDAVQPAAIADKNYPLGNHVDVWAAGWDVVFSGNPNPLRQFKMSTTDTYQGDCIRQYNEQDERIIKACAPWLDVGGRTFCNYEAPVYHNDTLIGVVHSQAGCGRLSPYFARVPKFHKWIQDNSKV